MCPAVVAPLSAPGRPRAHAGHPPARSLPRSPQTHARAPASPLIPVALESAVRICRTCGRCALLLSPTEEHTMRRLIHWVRFLSLPVTGCRTSITHAVRHLRCEPVARPRPATLMLCCRACLHALVLPLDWSLPHALYGSAAVTHDKDMGAATEAVSRAAETAGTGHGLMAARGRPSSRARRWWRVGLPECVDEGFLCTFLFRSHCWCALAHVARIL